MRHYVTSLGAIAAFGALLGAAPKPAQDNRNEPLPGSATESGEKPMAVTSDSPQYCRDLDARVVKALTNVPPNHATDLTRARELEQQGETLCNAGHVLPGITELRSALFLIRK